MATLAELEAVYRDGYPAFVRVATAIVGDEQLARDAVHDGFVRAVRHRRRQRGGPVAGWVWRIVVNSAHRLAADTRPRIDVPGDLPSTNGHEPDGRVRALVAALPERQKLALFLRYYADLDYESIATALGIQPGTVAASLHAAHSTLRAQLQEVHDD